LQGRSGGGVLGPARREAFITARRPASAASAADAWREGPRPARPRIALTVVLIAAAMPVRLSADIPVINSVSVLDILLIAAALTLYLDISARPLDLGYSTLFRILWVPLVLSIVSLVWSEDRDATLRSVFIYAEGLVAYLFVIRELRGLPAARIVTYIRRFAYLLIIPAVLLLLRVPGFQPQEAGLSETSGSYTSYYTRLSHPVLGRSNNLATVLAFFAPLLLWWGHTHRDRRVTVAAVVVFVAIFLTLSRGVLLAFLIAGVLYAPFAAGRRRVGRPGLGFKVTALVTLGFTAIAIFYTVNAETREFFAGRFSAENVTGRSALIAESLNDVAARPLLGYGGGASPDPSPLVAVDVHNTFLQQVVYFGLPLGLVASVALCAIAGFFLARRTTPLAGAIAYTVMVQLVLFLFESSFEGTVLRVLFYMSVGIAVALLRAVEHESSAVAPTRPARL
jgi:O-antigen ligase